MIVDIREAIDAVAAASGGIEAVQAIEQPAVDERSLGKQVQQCLLISNLITEAISGEITVCGVGFAAEPAPVDLGVQRGEEQILQHGAIVGIACVTVVVLQQPADLRFDEQIVGDQTLLLDEPYEQQPSYEPDDVLFR